MNATELFDQEFSIAGCSTCKCRSCMLWWSNRCPHGECFDSLRAKERPYHLAHPGLPPRTGWTNWKSEQAFWCRGGTTYPQQTCPNYVPYEGSQVKQCILSNVQVFQDGFILCHIIDSIGCTECYRRLEEHCE